MANMPTEITLKYDKDAIKKFMLKLLKEDEEIRDAVIKVVAGDIMKSGIIRDLIKAS